MTAFLVVVADPLLQPPPQRATGVKRMQVKIPILDGPPQALDEDVVLTATPAVHADFNLVILEHLGEGRAGELSPLVGIEDFRRTIMVEGFVERFDTKEGSNVLEMRQDNILRLYQSMMATRYIKPRTMGI